MRYFNILRYLIILLALLCTACGTALPTIKPYKMDVQQGNVVTSKVLLQLRPGMTKSQVRFIMGTPLIQDSFHGNRWDYVYQMREGGKVTEQRRVILDFENELLKGVRGDVIPEGSGQSKLDESKALTGTRVVESYKKPTEKGLIDKLKFWEKDEAAEKETVTKAVIEAVAVEKSIGTPVAKNNTPTGIVTPPDISPPTEEVKSILAVPVESLPIAEAVAPVPTTESSATEVIAVPVAQSTSAQLNVAENLPVAELQPIKALAYESPSGMIFDTNLRTYVVEALSVDNSIAKSSSDGNDVSSNPKGMPPENEPSFFDRMLEKIGF